MTGPEHYRGEQDDASRGVPGRRRQALLNRKRVVSAWVRVLAVGTLLIVGAPATAIFTIPTAHSRLVGEAVYPTLTLGKVLRLRVTLSWPADSTTLSGWLRCRPRRGLNMFEGDCPLSRGRLSGRFVNSIGEAGVTPSFSRVTFRVSGDGRTCEFSAFAPYLELGPALLALDGVYSCSDGTGTTTQAGRFSAFARR